MMKPCLIADDLAPGFDDGYHSPIPLTLGLTDSAPSQLGEYVDIEIYMGLRSLRRLNEEHRERVWRDVARVLVNGQR
jgi:hypothetical protein